MDIMVNCPCGHPFAFREEPLNGRLARPVSCPNCGHDGTDLAHQYIGQVLRGDPPPPAKRSWLGLGASPAKTRLDPADLQLPGTPVPPAEAAAGCSPARVALGATAALGVGALGALGWYWIAMKTGFHFGFLAWVIGGLVGLTSRLIVPDGSLRLAAVAGSSTFAAILAGHVLVLCEEVNQAVDKGVETAYLLAVADAKQAVKLKTDREIRDFLADHRADAASRAAATKQPADSGEKLSVAQQRNLYIMSFVLFEVMEHGKQDLASLAKRRQPSDPESYTEADLKEFREQEQPQLKALVEGQPSKDDWKAALSSAIYERIHFKDMITGSIGPYTIGWMIFGLLTAFKLARNKSETEDV